MLFQLATTLALKNESVWCNFSVGSASVLALLGFLLTCWDYKFTTGVKLLVRYGLDKARADL